MSSHLLTFFFFSPPSPPLTLQSQAFGCQWDQATVRCMSVEKNGWLIQSSLLFLRQRCVISSTAKAFWCIAFMFSPPYPPQTHTHTRTHSLPQNSKSLPSIDHNRLQRIIRDQRGLGSVGDAQRGNPLTFTPRKVALALRSWVLAVDKHERIKSLCEQWTHLTAFRCFIFSHKTQKSSFCFMVVPGNLIWHHYQPKYVVYLGTKFTIWHIQGIAKWVHAVLIKYFILQYTGVLNQFDDILMILQKLCTSSMQHSHQPAVKQPKANRRRSQAKPMRWNGSPKCSYKFSIFAAQVLIKYNITIQRGLVETWQQSVERTNTNNHSCGKEKVLRALIIPTCQRCLCLHCQCQNGETKVLHCSLKLSSWSCILICAVPVTVDRFSE